MARSHLGEITCLNPECGKPIPAKLTTGGHIAFPCGWCGLNAYAPPGSKSHRNITALIKPSDDDEVKPDTKPAPAQKPEVKPAPKPAEKTIFDHLLKTGASND